MTTGLHKVVALERTAPRPVLVPRTGWLRAVRHGFRHRMHLAARRPGAVGAPPTARDVHDAAVLRGVFPPRV